MNRRLTKISLALAAVATLGGCASARSFFQMSSDSPLPFFGVDLTLPPKFGRGSDVELGQPGETFGQIDRPSMNDESRQ